MTEQAPMTVVELQAENFKRLVAIEIRPDGSLVEITGKNGAGKSSVLDALAVAIGGKELAPKEPIRKGQDAAVVRVDLGTHVVIRRFKRNEVGVVSSDLRVETAEGRKIASPQAFLDQVLGALSVDPVAFDRLKPREQFDMLKLLVPEIDFDGLEEASSLDFDRRREINAKVRENETLRDSIKLPAGHVPAFADLEEIEREVESTVKHNAEIITRRERRVASELAVSDKRARAQDLRDTADALDHEVLEIEKKLADAGPLPEPIDIEPIRKRLSVARYDNETFALAEQRSAHAARAKELEGQAAALTLRMAAREKAKHDAIAAAKLPVEGLSFGEGEILLGGVPFAQASDAERLRASVAIAMSAAPTLRVVWIKDGSLLDNESRALIAAMASERGFQVWQERVTNGEKIGFTIVDGMVAS